MVYLRFRPSHELSIESLSANLIAAILWIKRQLARSSYSVRHLDYVRILRRKLSHGR